MHTRPLQKETQAKTDIPSYRVSFTESSRVKTNPCESSSHVDPGQFAVEFPSEFQHYVTTTNRSSEIYSAVKHLRVRRLRFLLRRFTNQIQYGCKNTLCDAPTCLSYRKRHSRVPVRPYNDLAARTLAWQLVEDYIGADGELSHLQVNTFVQKRGLKIKPLDSSNQVVRLCMNEPAIPWYNDPCDNNSQPKDDPKNHTTDVRTGTGRYSVSDNTTFELHVAEEQEKDQTRQNLVSDTHVQISVDRGYQVKNLKVRSNATRSGGIKKCTEVMDCRALQSGRTVRFENDSQPFALCQQQPIDSSSFSQVLFDCPHIRSFNISPPNHGKPENHGCSTPMVSLSSIAHHAEGHFRPFKESTCRNSTSCTNKVKTLKLLPVAILEWLVQHSPKGSESQSMLVKISNHDHVTLVDFAKQSLYYCLSHPSRLIASARLWLCCRADNQTGLQDLISNRDGAATQSNIEANIRSGSEPSSKRSQFPRMQDVTLAFNLMSQMQPHVELLEHIFAALQNAYIMPGLPSGPQTSGVEEHIEHHVKQSDLAHHPEVCMYSIEESSSVEYLHDEEVAYLCVLAALCLDTSPSPFSKCAEASSDSRSYYLSCVTEGRAFHHTYAGLAPKTASSQPDPKKLAHPFLKSYLAFFDIFNEPHILRLLCAIADVVSHRIALQRTLVTSQGRSSQLQNSRNIVDHIIVLLDNPLESQGKDSCHLARYLLDLMFVVLIKVWDRNSVVSHKGAVGGALQILAALFRNKTKFHLNSRDFELEFVANCFDDAKLPLEWLAFREDNKRTHILAFPFLFGTATLAKYFRASNIEVMRKAFEYARLTYADASHFLGGSAIPVPIYGAKGILANLRPHMARYFVVTVRRSHIVKDAIDQIWRRQRQELMRPLKISLGKEEGEDGLDHGGVQQEFFRIVFAEMLKPDYGMFSIEENTRMTWFQPTSLEPLYKFEALGILMSLAVYNAVTLPITFPVAFYRKLLGHKVKSLEHIEDGWPDLVRGLRILQTWSDGDVGDTIARTYEFSYHVYGSHVSIDMSRFRRNDLWPSNQQEKTKQESQPPTRITTEDNDILPRNSKDVFQEAATHHDNSSASIAGSHSNLLRDNVDEAPLVTNDTREQYIKDYIYWLVHKSIAPQFSAFAKGFYTCLDATALGVFTPEALKSVVEGETFIDVQGLRAATTYDDYLASDPIITDFWYVVDQFSAEQHKKLLEFVTASDRVPVSGIESVTFIIQRNGEGDDRLPSSSTCYGRLLLPKYSSWKILKEKLEKAIENSVGFGSL